MDLFCSKRLSDKLITNFMENASHESHGTIRVKKKNFDIKFNCLMADKINDT
jgi:hypothetical protein